MIRSVTAEERARILFATLDSAATLIAGTKQQILSAFGEVALGHDADLKTETERLQNDLDAARCERDHLAEELNSLRAELATAKVPIPPFQFVNPLFAKPAEEDGA